MMWFIGLLYGALYFNAVLPTCDGIMFVARKLRGTRAHDPLCRLAGRILKAGNAGARLLLPTV
jgi:hypothetical protein